MAFAQWFRDRYERSPSLRFAVHTARTIRLSSKARKSRPAFGGDVFLQEALEHLLASVPVRHVVETGTCFGDTSRYFATAHPDLRITTIESHREFFQASRGILLEFPNVDQIGMDGATAMRHLLLQSRLEGTPLFFLDLHRGNPLPVREEIGLIGRYLESAILVIRDFRVPGQDHFRYAEYDGEEIGLEVLRQSIVPERGYQVLVPGYTEREVFGDTPPTERLPGYALVFQECGDAFRDFLQSPLGARYTQPAL